MNALAIVGIVAAGIAGLALLVQIVQVSVTVMNERRRAQPIVVTHEVTSRMYDSQRTNWKAEVRAANEGQGSAFNVRFGVSYFGVRFAFRLNNDDPYTGNRERVLHPREEVGPWPIYVPSSELLGGRGIPEEGSYYWARYENAHGQTWETRNPPERSADLTIKRVRFATPRERLETRKRDRLGKEGRKREQDALRELRQSIGRDNDA